MILRKITTPKQTTASPHAPLFFSCRPTKGLINFSPSSVFNSTVSILLWAGLAGRHGKTQRLRIRRDWMWCLSWEHFLLDIGLSWLQGIFLPGKMSIVEREAVIRASPGWILILMEVLESFLQNLMVLEFRLLGEIPHGFCHFFVSDPIFAFRINCSIYVTFSDLWLFIAGTVDNSGFP